MDSTLIARQVQELNNKQATRKRSKPSNKRNQPLKVVYISNPMRVQTSAAKFRALVQELTGRDAEFPDPAQFHSAISKETNAQKIQTRDEGEELVLEDLAAIEDFNGVFFEDCYGSLEDYFLDGCGGEIGCVTHKPSF